MTTAVELEDAVSATVGTGDATRDLQIARAAIMSAYDYAPSAPVAILREAAIRTAGWLRDVSPGFSSATLDGDSAEYRQAHGSALRSSGAQALLSLYRVRRARGGF